MLESLSPRASESLSDVFVVVVGLHAVLLLEFEVLLPEGVDAVDHALHELDLGVPEAVLVRDVVGVACGDEKYWIQDSVFIFRTWVIHSLF